MVINDSNEFKAYKSTAKLTNRVVSLYWITIIINFIFVSLLIFKEINGSFEIITGCFGILLIFIYIIKGIFFLTLLYKMKKNTIGLGVKGTVYSPGWTVGWFFIPFANFFMVRRIITELWNSNDPTAYDNVSWQRKNDDSTVMLWFVSWAVTICFNLFINNESSSNESNNANLIGLLFIVSIFFDIIYNYCTIILLKRLQERQNQKALATSNIAQQKNSTKI